MVELIATNADLFRASGGVCLTKGQQGASKVLLTFSDAWEGLAKTAVFKAGSVTIDVVESSWVDGVCEVPNEVMQTAGELVRIGLYGTDGDSVIIPTVWFELGVVEDGTDPSGNASTDATLPVWAQIQAAVDALRADADAGASDGAPGADGVSVTEATIDASGHLVLTLSSGAIIDCGDAKGNPGAPGNNGISVTGATINTSGHLVLTLSSGATVDCGVAKGADGSPGAAGSPGATGSPGIAGSPGADGVSVTNATINTSGHLIITLSSGATVDCGVAKGADGVGSAGYTPVRGTDYWTSADVATIKSYVDDAILGGAW